MSSDFLSDLDKWVMESIEKTAEEAATSHPSANAEDGDQTAVEGARSSENETDVKAEVPGQNVDEAKGSDAEGPGRGENTPATEMANAKATGEDPANETSGVKAKPEDPGTSMPAKATMGEKYSSAQLVSLGDEILNDIAGVEAGETKQAKAEVEVEVETEGKSKAEKSEDGEKADKSDEGEKAEKSEDGEKADKSEDGEKADKSEDELKQAEAAGRDAAASIIEAVNKKQASAEVDQSAVIGSIVKNAAADAANVAEYLAMFQKAAMDGVAPEEVAALADAAVAEAPVTDAPAEAAALGAEAPMAGAGIPGMEGAGATGDAEIDALVDALVEAGIEPEELLALAGAGEGAPVDGGAPVEEVAPVAEEAAVAEAAPEAGAEDVVEEAVEDVPKEAAVKAKKLAEKKAAVRKALQTAAKKTA